MVEEAGGALRRVVRALRLQIALLIFDDELDADDDDDELNGDAGELGNKGRHKKLFFCETQPPASIG